MVKFYDLVYFALQDPQHVHFPVRHVLPRSDLAKWFRIGESHGRYLWHGWHGVGPILKPSEPYPHIISFGWNWFCGYIDLFELNNRVPQIVDMYHLPDNCPPKWWCCCFTTLNQIYYIIVIISIIGTVEMVIENYWANCLVHFCEYALLLPNIPKPRKSGQSLCQHKGPNQMQTCEPCSKPLLPFELVNQYHHCQWL